MLYFDLAIYKEDLLTKKELEKPKVLQNIIYFFRKNIGQVFKLNISGKELIVLSKINKRVLKKVDKILRIKVAKTVCISEELKLKAEFVNFVNSKNIKILDGRWLFKYLFTDVLEFICSETGLKQESQEISILTNENNILIFESIKKISEKVKNINIITRNINLFKKLEKENYEETGLILRVTNDFEKAALKSKIIFNLNFPIEDLNKIKFSKNTIIINFENEFNIIQKTFKGSICNFYHINLPEKYLNGMERFNKFDTTILYESFIYKKTAVKNIWKEIENDNVKINCLEGKNGIIKLRKMANMSQNYREMKIL